MADPLIVAETVVRTTEKYKNIIEEKGSVFSQLSKSKENKMYDMAKKIASKLDYNLSKDNTMTLLFGLACYLLENKKDKIDNLLICGKKDEDIIIYSKKFNFAFPIVTKQKLYFDD